MNALSDEVLRSKVTIAWQPNPGDHAASRTPLLASFITNATLLRVRELLVDDVPAGGLTTAIGYALAALTGAPQPACADTAHHIGNAAASRITHYCNRCKQDAKQSDEGQVEGWSNEGSCREPLC